MSWRCAAWAMKQRTGSAAAKLTLLGLADFADRTGKAWPAQQTLADMTEQSLDSVQRHLQQLEQLGLISRVRKQRRGGQLQGFMYQLNTKPQLAVWNQAAKSGVVTKPQNAARPPGRKYLRTRPQWNSSSPRNHSGTRHQPSIEEPSIEAVHAPSGLVHCEPSQEEMQSLGAAQSGSLASAPDGALASPPTEQPKPSYAEMQAKYPDLLKAPGDLIKRIPTEDSHSGHEPLDQRWQATPEPPVIAPSAALLRIELAKQLRRPVSDQEFEEYLAKQQAKA